MTITSSLRFLYIFCGSGLLCGAACSTGCGRAIEQFHVVEHALGSNPINCSVLYSALVYSTAVPNYADSSGAKTFSWKGTFYCIIKDYKSSFLSISILTSNGWSK